MDKNHHASRNQNHTLTETTPTGSRSKKLKPSKAQQKQKIPLENNGIQLAELGQMKSTNVSAFRNENANILVANKKHGFSMKSSIGSTRRRNDRAVGIDENTSLKFTKSYEHLNYEFENDENQQHNHRSHFQSDTNHLNLTEEQFMYSNNNINQDPFNIKKETDEDLDLNYKDEQDILFPGYVPYAFKYLSQKKQPRYFCLQLITSPWFERISMFIILVNCITLGMYQPCEDNPCISTKCVVLKYVDHAIYVFFVLEMTVKIIAMGFYGKNTYMAETWNRLDFFIVVAGTLEYAIASENLSLTSIRTVRVLRPLRAINRVPSMRILVMLLLDTLPMLGNVFLLCFFVFFIFGIIGVQLWKGVLRNRCYFDYNATTMSDILDQSFQSTYYTPIFTDSFVCSELDAGGMTTCSDIPPYINNSRICNGTIEMLRNGSSFTFDNESCINWNSYYTKCRPSDANPFKGSISFDNIGFAWVAIFQIISLESWVTIMYFIQDAHSFWDWIYFVFLIVIGSFFMINLCLVVIATQFSETKRRETERMIAERKRFSPTSSTIFSDFGNSEPGSCWTELLKFVGHIFKKAKRKLFFQYKNYKRKKSGYNPGTAAELSLRLHKKVSRRQQHLRNSLKNQCYKYHLSNHNHLNISCASVAENSSKNHLTAPDLKSNGLDKSQPQTTNFSEITSIQNDAVSQLMTTEDEAKFEQILGECTLCKKFMSSQQLLTNKSLQSIQTSNYDLSDDEQSRKPKLSKENKPHVPSIMTKILCCCCFDCFSQSRCYLLIVKFRRKLREFVESWVFQRAILSAILINTLSMGVEHHEQPPLLTSIVEYSNIIFSIIFLVEMLFKISAFGMFGYIKDGYNLFDGIIVMISVYELFNTPITDIDARTTVTTGQSISVLRTFRLLRILKLIRFMPALRRQLVVMLKTMDNVATFFSLLILFIFIFSILGMNLFGCKFCDKLDDGTRKCERKNFDSLLWATITVFQVLTQEDWNEVLYSGMDRTSSWAALYFIALMTFGNYVLFNLLVAILVEGFSTEDEPKKPLTERIMEDAINAIKEEARSRDPSNSGDPRSDSRMQEVNEYPLVRHSSREGRTSINEFNRKRDFIESLHPPIITHTCPTPILTRSRSSREKSNQANRTAFCRNLSLDSAFQRIKIAHLNSLLSKSSKIYNKSLVGLIDDCKNDLLSKFISIQKMCQDKETSQPDRLKVRAITRHGRSKSEKSHRNSERSRLAYPTIVVDHYENPSTDLHVKPAALSSQPSVEENIKVVNERTREDQQKSGQKPEANEEPMVFIKRIELKKFSWCLKRNGENLPGDASLYIFSQENKFRQFCIYVTAKKWFDYTVLLFIALNCITLAMERPNIPNNSFERKLLTYSNYIFTILFAIEMFLKVISAGLYLDEKAYLRSGWNIMDAGLVVVSSIDIILSFTDSSSPKIFGILRVFRLLRTLRPLRVISRAPGLKLVVQTLLSSLRPIGNIVLICCTFFIIFGILGVQLFKGKFYYCVGEDIEFVFTKEDCISNPRNQWVNTQYNFDNLGKALMALFVLSSKDGWVQIMYTGIDAVGVNMQPQENHNEWMLLYFISFLLLVGFFVLNMFVGVVIENFHKCRAEQEREEKAMRAAKRARKVEERRNKIAMGIEVTPEGSLNEACREVPYYANYSRPRYILHSVCNSKYFDLIIAAVIGLNVVSMSLEFYMMPEVLDEILDILNYIFTVIFLLEAILRIIALGFSRYIKDRWNQLDIIIVILSIIGILVDKLKSKSTIPINPTIIRVMRVLRIARVLKLLKMAKGIRSLLDTVIQALPQVGNLGLLFFLLFFIFATLGVELFGKLNCEGHKSACEGLSKHAHFHNFGMAFLTLFRIATGDNWNGIMKDTLKNNILCNEDDQSIADPNSSTCLASIIAPIYFVVFVLMAQFVLVNVVVAVLMKHLDESKEMIRDDADIDEEIEIQIEKERHLKETQEREFQKFKIFNGEDSPKALRKHTSLPSNFNFCHITDLTTTTTETQKNESTHSINSQSRRLSKTSGHVTLEGESDNIIVESTPVTTDCESSFFKQSEITLNKSPIIEKKISPKPAAKLNSNKTGTKPNRRNKPLSKLVHQYSTASYKTHFSPQPSIRIKIIDETDTDN